MISDYLMLRTGDLNCDLHINPELEILYVESGEASFVYEGGTALVGEGEAVMIMPYHMHGFVCPKNTKASVFMFSYSVAEDFNNLYKIKGLRDGKFTVDNEFKAFLFYMLKNLNFETDSCAVKSIFYSFASQFMKNNSIEQKDRIAALPVQEIVEYVFFHLSEELNLQKVSHEIGINKNTLSSIFKDSIGIPFGDFVNNVRVERAKFLLLKSDYKITEIAYECGFGSVRSLNRVFFKKVGLTPSDYRKKIIQTVLF